ncbi:hypothetical protein CEXT_293331, partial [Caerostris extrusa]
MDWWTINGRLILSILLNASNDASKTARIRQIFKSSRKLHTLTWRGVYRCSKPVESTKAHFG